MKSDAFYTFLEMEFSTDVKELIRRQGFSSANSLIHSNVHPLDIIQLNSKDPNVILVKQIIAFHQNDDTWIIKPGILYDVNCLMSSLRQAQDKKTSHRSLEGIFVSSNVFDSFPWLKSLIIFCQNQLSSLTEKKSDCLMSFIEHMVENSMKPPNRYRYSDQIEELAFVLNLLSGRQGYEFIRLNLPGAFPSITTLSNRFNENREKISEGQFRFDSLKDYFQSMNVEYAFASEDVTGVVKKVSYDCQSNSFVGFCPTLHSDGFPRSSGLDVPSFYDLENRFMSDPISPFLYIHAIQPIKSHSTHGSPFLLSAYGTDNKFTTSDVINRWLKIFDESLKRGIRIIGFSTDCDARYLRAMRVISNFFAHVPNYDFRKRSNVFTIDLSHRWKWFYLDSTQLFLVFQVTKIILLFYFKTILSRYF